MNNPLHSRNVLGRRSEQRRPVDRFHSVELNIGTLQMIYQFKIWNISLKGMCILIRHDSVVLDHLRVGDILQMKYHPMESGRPGELLRTQIQHITKEEQGRFKGHFLVGLSILEIATA